MDANNRADIAAAAEMALVADGHPPSRELPGGGRSAGFVIQEREGGANVRWRRGSDGGAGRRALDCLDEYVDTLRRAGLRVMLVEDCLDPYVWCMGVVRQQAPGAHLHPVGAGAGPSGA